MRLWSLLILTSSALALSACSTIKEHMGSSDAPKTKETVAASKPLTPNASAKEREEKEMAAVMGESGATPDTKTDKTTTDTAATDDTAAAPDTAPTDTADTAVPAGDTDTTTATDEPVPATTADNSKPADVDFTPGVPDGCPGVQVLPDTKSITYFDNEEDDPSGQITARAQLVNVKGGCDYTKSSVVVDIDMIMKGHISQAGRYQGREDLEAFMTFPYFIAVTDPDGKLIDKKIMATAMRFEPQVDDLDHAEKITQTIPLKDVGMGSKYTITLGFQLNRHQLDYNRGVVTKDDVTPSKPASSTPTKTSAEKPAPAKAKAKKAPEKKADAAPAPTATDTTTTSPAAPAKATSSGAKMTPIVE